MPFELPLERMTLPEKLQLMEALWDNITRNPDDLPSPHWHKEVLEDCRRKAESGEEGFRDWAAVKDDIRRQVS